MRGKKYDGKKMTGKFRFQGGNDEKILDFLVERAVKMRGKCKKASERYVGKKRWDNNDGKILRVSHHFFPRHFCRDCKGFTGGQVSTKRAGGRLTPGKAPPAGMEIPPAPKS